jgi:hypothetical protein
VVGLLCVLVALLVVLVAADGRSAYLLYTAAQGHGFPATLRSDDDLVNHVLPIAQLMYLACGIAFIVWFHRCYGNVPASDRRYSRGWAVWGWFVPIVVLWRPKQIANDMLRSRVGRFVSPRFVTVWWALFLVTLLAQPGLLFQGESVAEVRNRLAAFTVVRALELAAALAAIAVVRRITAGQLQAVARSAAGEHGDATVVNDAPARPRRSGRLPRLGWLLPAGMVVAVGTLLYLHSSGAHDASAHHLRSASAPDATPAATNEGAQHAAAQLVRGFVETEALGRESRARHLTSGAPPRLRRLGLWLGRLGASSVAVKLSSYTHGDTSDTVLVGITVRFGRRAYSKPVSVGTLQFHVQGGHVSSGRMIDHQYLASYAAPRSMHGQRATIVYGGTGEADAARELLNVADAEAPRLEQEFGGGRWISRPVIMLVPTERALAAACACTPDDVLGLEYLGRAYIVLREWKRAPDITQRASLVHELTHVAMHQTADTDDTVPTSLKEGAARYEEQLYAGRESYYYRLDGLQAAYQRGYPTLSRWESTDTEWDLSGGSRVELAYEDAFATVTMIVQRHGGIPAVRRLVRQFRHVTATTATGSLTKAQITRAFRRAIGVPFSTVEAEARAWVLSGAWRTPL